MCAPIPVADDAGQGWFAVGVYDLLALITAACLSVYKLALRRSPAG
jgi:hypothetical protein